MPIYAGHFDFTKPLLADVPSLYTPDECRQILADVETAEWLPATVNSHTGRVVDAKLRDSTTAIARDARLALDLFTRIRGHVPASMTTEDARGGGRIEVEVCGIFTPLRVYRYLPGQHFGIHQDQGYDGPDGARSLLTLMLYLNEDFEGGETEFPEQSRCIVPKTGAALWFQHMLLHAGRAVARGQKYVLRSDVLYRKVSLA